MTGSIERELAALAHAADSGPDTAALRAAVADRAEREGLLDVAYAPFDSPIGKLTVFTTRLGLAMLAYPEEGLEVAMGRVATRISPRILAAPRRTDPIRRELDAYFVGDLREFSTPVDWRLVDGFTARVLHATAEIPYGSVSTYREVAEEAGSPRAYRAAGNALHVNPIPIVVPCHRVLPSGGTLGGYGGGVERKEFLLRLEGAR
jgi:methylated-DNA-[protein]-cysteine S-methyltransferase